MRVGSGDLSNIAGQSIEGMQGVASLANRVHLLIKLAGSLAQLAKISGISESAIRSWRDGKSDPGVSNVVTLAEATGVRIIWLVTGDEPVFRSLTESDLANLEAAFNEYWHGFDDEIRRELALVRFAADYARGQGVKRVPGILRFDLGQFSDWVINRRARRPPAKIDLNPPFCVLSENAVIRAFRTVEDSLGAESRKYDLYIKEAMILQFAREETRQELEKLEGLTESDSSEEPKAGE